MTTAEAVKRLADAVTPNISGGNDAMGGRVESLTEAAMGITAALASIASAIQAVADAIENFNGEILVRADESVSHELSLGIRHGLMGADAPDHANIRNK